MRSIHPALPRVLAAALATTVALYGTPSRAEEPAISSVPDRQPGESWQARVPRAPFVVTGSVLFGMSWQASTAGAFVASMCFFSSCPNKPHSEWLAIPVIGPFVALDQMH